MTVSQYEISHNWSWAVTIQTHIPKYKHCMWYALFIVTPFYWFGNSICPLKYYLKLFKHPCWIMWFFQPVLWQVLMQYNNDCRQTYDIRRIKSQNLNVSHFVWQFSLPNPLNPGVKSKMKSVDAAPTISDWPTILLPTNMRLILEVCNTDNNQTCISIVVYSAAKGMVSIAAYIISTHICYRINCCALLWIGTVRFALLDHTSFWIMSLIVGQWYNYLDSC